MTAHNETSPLLAGSSSSSASHAPYLQQQQQPQQQSTALTANQRHQEAKGLIYMTLSALFFSFMSLLVSLTAKSLPSFEIVLFRGIIQTVLGVLSCRYLKISPFGNKNVRFLLFCRGLAGSCGLGCFFFALSVMPLADATVVFFLGPVFTAILGRIVLKEPFGPLDALASTMSLVGVVLVAKPTAIFGVPDPTDDESHPANAVMAMLQNRQLEDNGRLYGVLAAVCGAMCSAVAYVIVRKIGKQGAHSMQHVTYFGVVSCVVSTIGLYALQGGYVAPQGELMWTGLFTLGVAAFIGQVMLNSGLQLAPLGPGTLMRMNDIVFAFIFQITIQHQRPDLFSFLGATLVMACTAGMGLNKWHAGKKTERREKLLQDQQQAQQDNITA